MNLVIEGTLQCFLMPLPSLDKCRRLRQEEHPAQTFLPKHTKCVMIMNQYQIGRGPVYQRPAQVPHGRAPVEIMLLLGLVKAREKKEKASEEAAGIVEGETHTHKGWYFMTGRWRELEDMMERRDVDIL